MAHLVDAHVAHQKVERIHVLPVLDVVRIADGDDAAHDALRIGPMNDDDDRHVTDM